MIYSQVLARYLTHYEYSLKDTRAILSGGKDDILDLRGWRHRAIQTQLKVKSTRKYFA